MEYLSFFQQDLTIKISKKDLICSLNKTCIPIQSNVYAEFQKEFWIFSNNIYQSKNSLKLSG